MKLKLILLAAISAILVLPSIEMWSQQPVNTNPGTPCYLKSGTGSTADTTNHANCKASPGAWHGARVFNDSATEAYLKMYNLATDPSCGSATGLQEIIPIQPKTTSAGWIDIFSNFKYSAGVGFCVVGGATSTDNSPPPAGVFLTLSTN